MFCSVLLITRQSRVILYYLYTQIQGTIMVASVFQVIVGFSGLIGLVLRFIGPLTITPTITLIGLSLFVQSAKLASSQWWICIA